MDVCPSSGRAEGGPGDAPDVCALGAKSGVRAKVPVRWSCPGGVCCSAAPAVELRVREPPPSRRAPVADCFASGRGGLGMV